MQKHLNKWLKTLMMPDSPDEFETKGLLSQLGIAIPKGFRLGREEQDISVQLSPPYVAKVCSGIIMHKTDQGGVFLNLDNHNLPQAVGDLQRRFPDTPVLVEEQVTSEGLEFIIGALVDPAFGPAVMVGAGGVLTELYEDVSFRLAPCSRRDARGMIDELTVSPVFSGFRGLEMDADGLADAISIVGQLALDLGGRFSQLDINPIVYADNRWMALDAKLLLNE